MITAAEARAITNNRENYEQVRECIEKLSPHIKAQALIGNRYLFFFIDHLELEDLITAKLKDLGYEVFKEKSRYMGCPAYYTIRW